MIWQTSERSFDLSSTSLVMGILNVTPDSFSDGGRFEDPDAAVLQAKALVAAGAHIVDVGGESTRPGAHPTSEIVELKRVLSVIHRLTQQERIPVSIDTRKPAVARAAIEAGASIVNDVGGLRDPAMRRVVRETRTGAVIMHMQGTPDHMQLAPSYACVTTEVRGFFQQILDACTTSGIDPEHLAFDPGIGFGKTLPHNLELLSQLPSLRPQNRPLVLGVSRKSFLGKILASENMADRDWPTVALSAYGRLQGAQILRVHDPRPNSESLRMTEALLHP
jgi:dihydropteroate synthase